MPPGMPQIRLPSLSDFDEDTGQHARNPLQGVLVEQERALEKYNAILKVRASTPSDPEPGLSEAEHARHLVYTTLTALVRNEMVLNIALDAVEANNATLRQVLEVKHREISVREREVAAQEREQMRADQDRHEEQGRQRQIWATILRSIDGVATFMGRILTDPRTLAAGVGSVVTAIGAISAWLFNR